MADIAFLVLGFWDVKAVWDSDLFRDVGVPLLGILVISGGLKLALNRHV